MNSANETLEDRIRERAYHIWEASGRPSGRDEEFWLQACESIADPDSASDAKPKPRRARQPRATKPPNGRARKAT